MGYSINAEEINKIIALWSKDYLLYAPTVIRSGGAYSDTDVIHYSTIQSVEEIEFKKKSDFSYKEIILPISQTLFYYTEDNVAEANHSQKGAIIFLRSCDLNSIKRLDEIYLLNGAPDYYYNILRNNVKFILMGCENSFDNYFCVDMGSNQCADYDASIDLRNGKYYIDVRFHQ